MDLTKVLTNNRAWAAEQLDLDETYFEEMAKGQTPSMLYIGCSDSRVTAEIAMGLKPGEVFVHRNIANLIPNNDLSSAAVIEYAVEYLKVKHILVCGHYECGGVKAAMQSTDLGIINPWLLNIRDIFRTHQRELQAIGTDEVRYRRLVELNVAEQCFNLSKNLTVQRAIGVRKLQIHGWVFDIRTGKFIDLHVDVDLDFKNDVNLYDLTV